MRLLFILLFIANLAVTLISMVVLPDRVAIHFGADGMANGWAPNYINAILMTGVYILIYCVIYFSPRCLRLVPSKWINLPHKEYWLSPANQALAVEKMQGFMWRFGVAIMLLFLVDGLLTIQANLSKFRMTEAKRTPIRFDKF